MKILELLNPLMATLQNVTITINAAADDGSPVVIVKDNNDGTEYRLYWRKIEGVNVVFIPCEENDPLVKIVMDAYKRVAKSDKLIKKYIDVQYANMELHGEMVAALCIGFVIPQTIATKKTAKAVAHPEEPGRINIIGDFRCPELSGFLEVVKQSTRPRHPLMAWVGDVVDENGNEYTGIVISVDPPRKKSQ